MPARAKKLLIEILTEHLTLTFTNFLQVRKKLLQKLVEEMARGHSKGIFPQNFKLLTPSTPLFVPDPFT